MMKLPLKKEHFVTFYICLESLTIYTKNLTKSQGVCCSCMDNDIGCSWLSFPLQETGSLCVNFSVKSINFMQAFLVGNFTYKLKGQSILWKIFWKKLVNRRMRSAALCASIFLPCFETHSFVQYMHRLAHQRMAMLFGRFLVFKMELSYFGV